MWRRWVVIVTQRRGWDSDIALTLTFFTERRFHHLLNWSSRCLDIQTGCDWGAHVPHNNLFFTDFNSSKMYLQILQPLEEWSQFETGVTIFYFIKGPHLFGTFAFPQSQDEWVSCKSDLKALGYLLITHTHRHSASQFQTLELSRGRLGSIVGSVTSRTGLSVEICLTQLLKWWNSIPGENGIEFVQKHVAIVMSFSNLSTLFY